MIVYFTGIGFGWVSVFTHGVMQYLALATFIIGMSYVIVDIAIDNHRPDEVFELDEDY